MRLVAFAGLLGGCWFASPPAPDAREVLQSDSPGSIIDATRYPDATIVDAGPDAYVIPPDGTPSDPTDFSCIQSVNAGDYGTCAQKTSGTAQCWGVDATGEVGSGTGTFTNRDNPTRVRNLASTAAEIVQGGAHTCARMTNGTVWCWGRNTYGNLGHTGAPPDDTDVPVQVSGITTATQLDAGENFTCALLADKTVSCWGRNEDLQLGDNTGVDRDTPAVIPNLTNVVEITTGQWHACARKGDGTLWCWGYNTYGSVGDGSTTRRGVPTKSLVTGVAQVSGGAHHTCALKTDHTVWCFGDNFHGQIGDSTYVTRVQPTEVVTAPGVPLTNVAYLNTGAYHVCAVLTDHTMKCWGWNYWGQVGNGESGTNAIDPDVATTVAGVSDAAKVTAGFQHTCIQRTSNQVACWGDGRDGQLGGNIYTGSPVAVNTFLYCP